MGNTLIDELRAEPLMAFDNPTEMVGIRIVDGDGRVALIIQGGRREILNRLALCWNVLRGVPEASFETARVKDSWGEQILSEGHWYGNLPCTNLSNAIDVRDAEIRQWNTPPENIRIMQKRVLTIETLIPVDPPPDVPPAGDRPVFGDAIRAREAGWSTTREGNRWRWHPPAGRFGFTPLELLSETADALPAAMRAFPPRVYTSAAAAINDGWRTFQSAPQQVRWEPPRELRPHYAASRLYSTHEGELPPLLQAKGPET